MTGLVTCKVVAVGGPYEGLTIAHDAPLWKRVVFNLAETDGSDLVHRYVKPRGKAEARWDTTTKGYRFPLAGETEGR